MTDDEELTDAERLEDALHEVVGQLVAVVGLPPITKNGPRVRPDGWPELVDPDRVPAGAVLVAVKALDMAGLGIAALKGEPVVAVTLEDGLAHLTSQQAPPC